MELAFTRSTNGGSSFSNVISINNNDENSVIGDIAAVGKNVYITWKDESLPNQPSHAFFIRSTNNGQSFDDIKDLGSSGSAPQLDTVSSNVYVVWANDDENIAFRASTNNGASFGSTKILSNDGNSSDPQISSWEMRCVLFGKAVPQILMYSLGQAEMKEVLLAAQRI